MRKVSADEISALKSELREKIEQAVQEAWAAQIAEVKRIYDLADCCGDQTGLQSVNLFKEVEAKECVRSAKKELEELGFTVVWGIKANMKTRQFTVDLYLLPPRTVM